MFEMGVSGNGVGEGYCTVGIVSMCFDGWTQYSDSLYLSRYSAGRERVDVKGKCWMGRSEMEGLARRKGGIDRFLPLCFVRSPIRQCFACFFGPTKYIHTSVLQPRSPSCCWRRAWYGTLVCGWVGKSITWLVVCIFFFFIISKWLAWVWLGLGRVWVAYGWLGLGAVLDFAIFFFFFFGVLIFKTSFFLYLSLFFSFFLSCAMFAFPPLLLCGITWVHKLVGTTG